MRERERERERVFKKRNLQKKKKTKYSIKISNKKSSNSFISNLKGETLLSIGLNKNYIFFFVS